MESDVDVQYVDSHAHIFLKDFDADREAMLAKCREKSVSKIYMPNLDHTSIDSLLETESKYPSTCKPMMGLHPCYVKKDFEKELYLVETWLNKRPFAAIGEVGTDLYWDSTFFTQQQEALKIQIGFAKKYQLPLVLHCRNSVQETIDLVKAYAGEVKGVFHCFSGTLAEAKEIIDMGFMLGIGGVATFKNGGLDIVLPKLELNSFLLETDSPYLTPAPFRKQRNDPSFLPLIAEKLAFYLNKTVEEVAQITTENCIRLFKL